MLDPTKRQFIWLECRYGNKRSPTKGPYWTPDPWQIHGRKYYHSLEQLLDLPFSNAVLKRLRGARVGTEIRVYSTGGYSDHAVRRLSDAEVSEINILKDLEEKKIQVREDIERAVPKLIKEGKLLDKKIRKEKNKLKKSGLIR